MKKLKTIIIISLLFILIFNTNSFAIDLTKSTLNYEQAEYIFNFFGNKIENYPEMTSTFSIIYQGNYYNDTLTTTYTNFNALNNKENIQAFISAFNTFNQDYNNLSIYNYLFLVENRGGQKQFYIYALPIGQTWGNNNIGFLQFYNSTNKNGVIKSVISYRDGTITDSDNYKYFRFTLGTTTNYTQINFKSSMTFPIWYKVTDTTNNKRTFTTYKNDTNYISKIGMCTLRHSTLYATSLDYMGSTPQYKSKILYSWYQKIQDDNNTSSGDTEGTGSGDGGNTGESKVDLTKIENGIGQINQNIGKTNEKLDEIKEKIPTSGDIATGTIKANEEYWGNSGDLNPDKTGEDIKDVINNTMDNISGELSKNEIFKTLETAEKGFFDLFKKKQEEKMYDLKLKWNETKYQETTLLESGEINISKMCREIPELARLQGYIRLIFNFTVITNLIKQIYNLILSTLGIDNPYLYEEGEETTIINEETGEYKKYYKKRKKDL